MKAKIVDLKSKFVEAKIKVCLTQYHEKNSNHDQEGKDLVDDLMEQKQVTYLYSEKIISSNKAYIEELNLTLNKKIQEVDSKAL